MHLRWLAVHSDHQSVGIGTLSLGRAIDDFYHVVDRTGIAALTLTPINQKSAKFYKDLGFMDRGSGEIPPKFLPAETVIRLKEAFE